MKMKWIWSTIPDPLFFFTSRVSFHDYNSTIPFYKMSKETFFFDTPIFYFGRIITIMRIFQAWNWAWWGENCLSPLWRGFALPRTFECWYCPLCIWKGGKRGERNGYDRHSKRERETLTRCNFWITQHSPCRIWGASQVHRLWGSSRRVE